MAGPITRAAYEQLIAEDLAWLLAQPSTLERSHIILILARSADHEYPPIEHDVYYPQGAQLPVEIRCRRIIVGDDIDMLRDCCIFADESIQKSTGLRGVIVIGAR